MISSFFRNRDRDRLEAYRKALAVYANPKNWGGVGSFGKVHPRRWIGGGNGIDLAKKILEEQGEGDRRNS